MNSAYQENYNKFIEIFYYLSSRYEKQTVFYDLVKMGALSIYNGFCKNKRIEEEYICTIKKYSSEEQKLFPKMFGNLIFMYENANEVVDILGKLFEQERLGNGRLGQFFTPAPISNFMSEMMIGQKENLEKIIKEKGFITLQEPSCGAGRFDNFCCSYIKKTKY